MSDHEKIQADEHDRLVNLCLFRLKLLENGYEPIPIKGKLIHISGWTTGDIDRDRIINETTNYRDHPSTGLRCGRLVGVDIDLRDEAHAEAIREVVEDTAGPTRLKRRGAKGMMMCYRQVDDPLGKLIIAGEIAPADSVDGERPKPKTLVEIFGKGTQFVAYGVHPDTGKPYKWLEPGQEPLLVPVAELPPVNHETIHRLRDRLQDRLIELGYVVGTQVEKSHPGPPPIAGNTTDAVDVTDLILARLPASANRSGRGYINFVCPNCCCQDKRSGIQVLSNGGFNFKCFHAGCEYHKATGWQPPARYVGQRVIKLYELLGGNPKDLSPQRRLPGYESVADMMASLGLGAKK